MKKLISIIILTIFTFSGITQERFLSNEEEMEDLAYEVTSLFEANKISKAFKKLSPYWPLPQNEIELVEEKSLKLMNLVHERFGNSIESVFIKDEKIGDFALRKTYMIRYDNTAIRLIFTFYKGTNGWIVNAFKWDDAFDKEFK